MWMQTRTSPLIASLDERHYLNEMILFSHTQTHTNETIQQMIYIFEFSMTSSVCNNWPAATLNLTRIYL